MKRLNFFLVLLASFFLLISSAHAVTFKTFNDEATFLAAAGPGLNLVDFEGLGWTYYQTYDPGNGVVFSSTLGFSDDLIAVPAGYNADVVTDSLFANYALNPIIADFSAGVNAVGSDVISVFGDAEISITVEDDLGYISNYLVNPNPAYFGIIASGGDILNIKYFPDNEWVGVDNFYFGKAAPVPEPATMLLLGSGLLGLVAISRKKFFKK